MARNAWFQRFAVKQLLRMHAPGPSTTVFAYSYAASEIFRMAKRRGWRTVLGQIDPGPVEAHLVSDLYASAGQAHVPIPEAYWETWRRETTLADAIVVNSRWSEKALVAEGVDSRKIRILPLAFEGTAVPAPWRKPPRFDATRPLRLLFLGQVTLRKGIHLLLDALAQMPTAPVQVDIVGELQIDVPTAARTDRRITFHGAVPRGAVNAFYAAADVFVFPTLSDGFGLTQLEAVASGLPIIASARCGEVVENGITGRVIDPIDANVLANVIAEICANPQLLAEWRAKVQLSPRFSIDCLGAKLAAIEPSSAANGPLDGCVA